jgi:hypothetical protein
VGEPLVHISLLWSSWSLEKIVNLGSPVDVRDYEWHEE